jgi:hypothetical protein
MEIILKRKLHHYKMKIKEKEKSLEQFKKEI